MATGRNLRTGRNTATKSKSNEQLIFKIIFLGGGGVENGRRRRCGRDFLFAGVVRSGYGSRTGSVMDVARVTSDVVGALLRPVRSVVAVCVGRSGNAVDARRRVATARPRVNDGVVVAVGRVRARRVHRRAG